MPDVEAQDARTDAEPAVCKLDTIYLIHHSHADFGYTHDPPVVWEMHRRFIDAAIDAADAWGEDGGDHAFRWTVECLAPLLHWLERAPLPRIERFLALEKAGRIEVTALYANMTPLLTPAATIEMLQPLLKLREQYGLRIRYAMSCDVNGYNWGLADMLMDAGIEGFSMAINEHAGGAPFVRPNLFRWQTPSGRELPVLNGWHYHMGNWLQIGEDAEALRQRWLPVLQEKLDEARWEWPVLLVQLTHRYGDNGSVALNLPEYVKAWNEAGTTPRLKLATPRDWWEAVAGLRERLPTHRGDWTDFWNFGCGSSAAETAVARQSERRLVIADAVMGVEAACGRVVADTPGRNPEIILQEAPKHRLEAWRHLLLWDEHTWGADISVRHPESEDTTAQWHHKAHHAWQARSLSLMLQRDAMAEMALRIPRQSGDALIVHNPLPWPRPAAGPVPAVVLAPRGSGEDAASSRHTQDRDYGPSTSWLPGMPIPGFGHAIIGHGDLLPGDDEPDPSTWILENEWFELKLDKERGGIGSWLERATGQELVQAGSRWTFGALVEERANERSQLYEGRYGLHGGRGWNAGWTAEWRGLWRLLDHQVVRTPAWMQAIQTYRHVAMQMPLTVHITLFAHEPCVEISYDWTMGKETRPHAFFAFMPFNLKAPMPHLDIGGLAMRPEIDQLPGCCRDWFTVQNWVDLASAEDGWGVTIACPDNPMVMLGGFQFARENPIFLMEHPWFLGWITNNYWDTNFRAGQPGRVHARYRLRPYRGSFDETRAHRYGLEAACPLVFQSGFEPARPGANLPRRGSLLRLPEPPILVPRLRRRSGLPAGTLDAVVMNASNEPQTAVFASAILTILSAEICNIFGQALNQLPLRDGELSIPLDPRETATIRLHTLLEPT